jgi:hypothetical protein
MGSLNDSTTTTSTRTSSPRTNSSDTTPVFSFSNYNIKSYEKADEINIKLNGGLEIKRYEKYDKYELRKSDDNDINPNLFDVGKKFEFKIASFANLSSFYLKNLSVNLNINFNEDEGKLGLNELNELKIGNLQFLFILFWNLIYLNLYKT